MPAGGPHNITPLYTFYQNYIGEKALYQKYFQRASRGMDPNEAIKNDNKRIKGRIDETGRTCSKCHIFKPWNEYSSCKTGTNGYTSNCKECVKEQHKKYRSTFEGKMKCRNYKIIKKQSEEYMKKCYETHRLYVERNKDRIDARRKEWYDNNKATILRKRREWEKKRWGIGKKVEFNGSKYTIVGKDEKKGLLINGNGIRIYVRKSWCKAGVNL